MDERERQFFELEKEFGDVIIAVSGEMFNEFVEDFDQIIQESEGKGFLGGLDEDLADNMTFLGILDTPFNRENSRDLHIVDRSFLRQSDDVGRPLGLSLPNTDPELQDILRLLQSKNMNLKWSGTLVFKGSFFFIKRLLVVLQTLITSYIDITDIKYTADMFDMQEFEYRRGFYFIPLRS